MKRWVIAAMDRAQCWQSPSPFPSSRRRAIRRRSGPSPVTQAVDDLERAIEKRRPGSSTPLLVHRNGGDLYIVLGS